MSKTDFKTINEYHQTFPPDVQQRMQQIRGIIDEIAPEAEEVISYQIPAFKHNGFLIYYSAYSKHITLSYPWSAAFLAHFESELKHYKMSKSAIQLPLKDDLPLDLIRRIVTFRKKENDKK